MPKEVVKRMVEVQTVIESEALKEDMYICIDRLMNCICAPKPGKPKEHSIIFWTKESADDKVKTWDKVVCPTSDSNTTNLETYVRSSPSPCDSFQILVIPAESRGIQWN